MLRLICGYVPQSGRNFRQKQSFYDELKCEWDMHSAHDLLCAWVTLMDTLVGILMDSMDGMVYIMNLKGRMLNEKD